MTETNDRGYGYTSDTQGYFFTNHQKSEPRKGPFEPARVRRQHNLASSIQGSEAARVHAGLNSPRSENRDVLNVRRC